MILQTSPASAIVKIHNISREFSMPLQIFRRRYYPSPFSRVEIIRHRVSREMIFWCCNIFCVIPTGFAADYFAVPDATVSRVACLFFFFFFLRVAFSYFYPETNRVSRLPRIYIRRGLRVSNARHRPSTRFSANDIVITMSWVYCLRA